MIELIFYVALVGTVAVVTINTILILSTVLGEARLERKIQSSAEVAVRRMSREMRLANDIYASSTLGVSPGVLSVASVESEEDTTPQDVMLYVDNGSLVLRRGAGSALVLTGSGVFVDRLVFRQLVNGSNSKSAKVELTLRASLGKASTTMNYYLTTVLRGSYQQ